MYIRAPGVYFLIADHRPAPAPPRPVVNVILETGGAPVIIVQTGNANMTIVQKGGAV